MNKVFFSCSLLVFLVYPFSALSAGENGTNQLFTNYSVTPTEQIAANGLPAVPPVPYRWNFNEIDTLNSTQKAFDKSKPTDSTLVIDNYNDLETYKVRLRVFMSTLFLLPPQDEIVSYKIGDQSVFRVHQNGTRILSVQPEAAGADTSLHIEGKSGNFYTFYLRSDNEKSVFVPHLKVLIKDRFLEEQSKKAEEQEHRVSGFINSEPGVDGEPLPLPEHTEKPTGEAKEKSSTEQIQEGESFDFLEEVSVRPQDFNFNYKIEGSSDEWWNLSKPSDELRPTFVYDDGTFTYFQFGTENTTAKLSSVPAIFRVADGSDVPTNPTPFGATIRVEGVYNNWTLRLGEKYLCLSRIVPLQKRQTNLALELK